MNWDAVLGLILNVLFWSVGVLCLVFIAAWIATEYFPGRGRKEKKDVRTIDSGGKSGIDSPEKEGEKRYRKAS